MIRMNKFDYAIETLEEEMVTMKKYPENYYKPEDLITELQLAIEVLKKEGKKE